LIWQRNKVQQKDFYQVNKLNDTNIIVAAKLISPIKKNIPAVFSNFSEWVSFFVRIERKERIQLTISIIAVRPVISSITVAAANFEIFIEVSTTKQNPSRLDELFNM
jgi:hypothetical protein